MIRLTEIGTGTVAPYARRAGPAHWVEAGPVRLLMDVGPGALLRLATMRHPWPTVTHVALSHYDVDHWSDLAPLLLALRWGTEPARDAPLHLLGPGNLSGHVDDLSATYGRWVRNPDYGLVLTSLVPAEPVRLAPDVILECFPTPHTDESVALSVRHGTHRLVFTGDTGVSPDLAAWAHGCDLLLAECSLPEARAIDIHLSPRRAGQLAHDAGARRLVLTHCYPPVDDVNPAAEAATVFGGLVELAEDGSTYVIE